ncbi:MAG: hypothetical protein WDO74_14990 [Pseudomonadota bacterium]
MDQLSVAESVTDGAVKIFVAIADVDALVKKDSAIDGPRAHEHDLGVHRGTDFSDASGATIDRPHIPR